MVTKMIKFHSEARCQSLPIQALRHRSYINKHNKTLLFSAIFIVMLTGP